jgi:aspartate aminotransferase
MPASPIRKLVPFADKAKERGIHVYHLNIGQPDIPTPAVALEAMRSCTQEVIEYTHSAGNLSYRKKLAGYYRGVGIDITEKNILVTTGGSEAINFAFMSTLNPGDEIIIPEPFYANYYSFATICGVTIKTVTSYIEQDFALPPIAEIEKVITPRTRGIVIVNPNNPTGYLYSREELEQVAALVKKHDLFLYADEVYREFCYDGLKHFSTMQLEGLEQNVILVDSVSKRYSECGLRVGAIISRNEEVMATALKFGMARLCSPAIGQIIAEASLDTPAEYFKAVNSEYRERRDFMVEALNKMPGVVCPKPKGAFYAVVQLPVDDSDKFARWLLEEFEYERQTVMVAPASGFYSTPGLGRNQVRIAYVLKISELKRAMQVLAKALECYPGRVM